jgi:acyl carrier protein
MKSSCDANRIIQEVREYIIKNILIGVSDGELDPEDSLLQRGILNSTGVLELVGFLEAHYSVRCGDDEITPENLDSLSAIAAFIKLKKSETTATH